MSGKSCQLLVSPCSVSPALSMIQEHQSRAVRIPSLSTTQWTSLSPSSGRKETVHSLSSGKPNANHVVLPALSLRRQVLTNGKHLASPDESPLQQTYAYNPQNSTVVASAQTRLRPSNNSFKAGCFASGLGHTAAGNPTVTNNPLTFVKGQSYGRPLPTSQSQMNSVQISHTDARSLLSRESLASTTLSLFDTQSVFSGRHDWTYGYRVLPPLGPPQHTVQANEGTEQLSLPLGTTMSATTLSGGTSTSASLPSYLFAGETRSPRQAHAKKRALSISPFSDVMGIDFNSIIRTSPTSLVAYINGSRSSPASHPTFSPIQSDSYGHFVGVRGCYISQIHHNNMPDSSQALALLSECGPIKMLEDGGCLESQMANMVVEQQCLPDEEGMLAKTAESCGPTTNSFMPSLQLEPAPNITVQDATSAHGLPPPYHSHQHILLSRHHCKMKPTPEEPTTQAPMVPPGYEVSFLSQEPMMEEDEGELEDYGSHCCRWLDCSAVYDQREELVRHIEKLHVDQRQVEDYTCYWMGCPRNHKPFNARYKLLIHMRVHSGERPNKCSFEGCKKAFSRLENLKIHLRSHTGEKPYMCQHPGCQKAFSNSSDRAKHQRTHLDTKPYACQVLSCAKRYTDPSSLRKHMKCHSTKERQMRKKMKSAAEFNQDALTDCLTIHPLQPSLSPQTIENNVNHPCHASYESYPGVPQEPQSCTKAPLTLFLSLQDNYRLVDPSPQLFLREQFVPCPSTLHPPPPPTLPVEQPYRTSTM
ncbi:zinc finger protein GLIS3 isoform X2 [Gouania willdenowi]|uniref:Zinc finger protein GLIS3-like n=1 Tax=Gouania willdenowi TaxID=441366 RepID=A0A8C5E0J9_GOUWI|nr:zinc finger protein GLIS3-like isoform X2 [Gouania willdenowi]